jgi:hypothetical protein
MSSPGMNSGLPSGHIIFPKDCWSESWTSSWHLLKVLIRYCSMHRLLIICANMQVIMQTMMPRNKTVFLVDLIPSSRSAWILLGLIILVS